MAGEFGLRGKFVFGKEVERAQRARRWRGHLGAWAVSGLSQAAYCRKCGLKAADFSWWKRALARRDGMPVTVRARAATYTGTTLGQGASGAQRQQSAVHWGRGALPQPGAAPADFIPVRLLSAPAGYPYEVCLSSGQILRVGAAFEAATLRTLLAVLEEGAPC